VPGSGQKLFGITDLPRPEEIRIERADEDSAGNLTVVFAPDGHTSHFPADWLEEHRPGSNLPHDDRAEDAKVLWQAADFADALPAAAWNDFAQDPATLAACLESLLRNGFFILRNVPVQDRAVLAAAEVFGFVRDTNYGTLFEVRVEENPANLAFSALPITPHTDNPYRDPAPTIQLLPDEITPFYAAYRAFAELLYRGEARLDFRLEPGDCVVFDNTRTLHARTGFTASGHRHLQGCYADLDSAASTLAVLRRTLTKDL
jgi:hypothetical protein